MDIANLCVINDSEMRPSAYTQTFCIRNFFVACQAYSLIEEHLPQHAEHEICRFAQEAICTQFLITSRLKHSISQETLHSLFTKANELISFFLTKREWKACVSAMIALPGSTYNMAQSNQLVIMTIGEPMALRLSSDLETLSIYDKGQWLSQSEQRSQMHIGSFACEWTPRFEVSIVSIEKRCPLRVLIGSHQIQQLSPGLIKLFLSSHWENLEATLHKALIKDLTLPIPPFSIFEASYTQPWWSFRRACKMIKRLIPEL